MEVVVIGVGAMGGGMGKALVDSPLTKTVVGYDRSTEAAKRFYDIAQQKRKEPNSIPTSLQEVITRKNNFTLLSLVNESQCDDVCFGVGDANDNLLSLMPKGSCVVLTSTVTATWAKQAAEKFRSSDIFFVDCPISGGPARASTGDLTVMASGDAESLEHAKEVLGALAREVFVIKGGAGQGSMVKCVHQLLAGVHICAAAEAMAMAAKAKLDVEQLYQIVNGAAGASWMFTDRAQRMLVNNPDVKSALDIFVKDLNIVHEEAKKLASPIPVASACLQQFISCQGLGLGKCDDSQVVKIYEQITGVRVADKKEFEANDIIQSCTPSTDLDVVVIGVGAMGGGMGKALVNSSITKTVTGYDRSVEAAKKFFNISKEKAPKSQPTSLNDAISDTTDFVVLSLVNEVQCEEVCFGGATNNLLSLMPKGSCVILTSTVTATWSKRANEQFRSAGIYFVDSPISGGPARAGTGDLTVISSGDDESLRHAKCVLDTLAREVFVIKGGAGQGSMVKCVHQLLAGVHICAAAEAMAMAAKAGLDVKQLYEIVNGAAGASWMFTDRAKRMLEEDAEVRSALNIFVKDLNIVHEEARALAAPIPVASACLQQYISGQGLDLGRCDDSQVVKVYECITGAKVASSAT